MESSLDIGVTEGNPTNTTVYTGLLVNENSEYDFSGAMYFTVAVVLVYGLSIVALIATHMRGGQSDEKDESRQVTRYLQNQEQMKRQGELDRLVRLQCKLGFKEKHTECDSSEISLFLDGSEEDPTLTTRGLSTPSIRSASRLSGIPEEDKTVQLENVAPLTSRLLHLIDSSCEPEPGHIPDKAVKPLDVEAGSMNKPLQRYYTEGDSTNKPLQRYYTEGDSTNKPSQRYYIEGDSTNKPLQRNNIEGDSTKRPLQQYYIEGDSTNKPLQRRGLEDDSTNKSLQRGGLEDDYIQLSFSQENLHEIPYIQLSNGDKDLNESIHVPHSLNDSVVKKARNESTDENRNPVEDNSNFTVSKNSHPASLKDVCVLRARSHEDS